MYLFRFSNSLTELFASFCSVNNNYQLIEIYFLIRIDVWYYGVVTELKQNQNLSVMLVTNKALIGYRCKYHQLASAPNMSQSLNYITLRYCLINDDVANVLSSYFTNSHNLERLYITDCRFETDQALLVILQALAKNSQFRIIDLNKNRMTKIAAKDLANLVKDNPHLEELLLSGNDLRSSVAIVLKALMGNLGLKKINLNKNKITGQVAEDLANIIKNNPGLQHVALSGNDLKLTVVVILQALAEISQLGFLDLSTNNMTELVAENLANVIKSNSGLEELNLSDNDLKSSAVIILQALTKHSHLKVLDLSRNNITGEIADDLATAIKNNTGLRHFSLAGNYLNSKSIVILQALANTA